MPRLELVRHAMTQGNLEGRWIGTTDEPLCPRGIALARANARPPEKIPRRIWTSPLRRCRETASLLYPGAEQIAVPAFRETAFGPLENKNHRELEGEPFYRRWLESGGTAPIPGMESREEVSARVLSAFAPIAEELCASREEGAIVAHGGVIMALCAALGSPEEDYYRRRCPCCGGWVIDLAPWRQTGKFLVTGPVKLRKEEPPCAQP